MTYEDVSAEVSKGSVPFLEHDNEDAWDVVPSETSLPSALACIEYLLLTRLARNPPVKEAIGGVAYRLREEVENLFQLEIIQVLNFVAWSQLEAMQLARTFVPLIRKGIFEEVIRFQAAKNNLQKMRLMVNVLDFVSREVECCKLLMGWRVSQLAWSSNFRFMNTIIGLLGAKAESMEKLAVSIPFRHLFTGCRLKLPVAHLTEVTSLLIDDPTLQLIWNDRMAYCLVSKLQFSTLSTAACVSTSNRRSGCSLIQR